ncbi:Transcription repressor OFP12, partial [Mucuna pruriens]
MPTGERRRKRNNLNRLNLNLCFSNPMQPFTPESSNATSSSVDLNHHRPSSPATSSILITNFSTLYDHHTEPEPADLATAFASQRFFFSSPGRSNSIVESTNTDCTTSSSSPPPPPDEPVAVDDNVKAVFNGSVAVATYSPDPYADFRRSMEEMVEARPELMDVKSNWHVLHELLLCYLALNPKSTHKFILGAFADLLVSLISPPPQNPSPGDVAGFGDGFNREQYEVTCGEWEA